MPGFSVPWLNTPLSSDAQLTRAVMSKLRPLILAAAWSGMGDIGGLYTYLRSEG